MNITSDIPRALSAALVSVAVSEKDATLGRFCHRGYRTPEDLRAELDRNGFAVSHVAYDTEWIFVTGRYVDTSKELSGEEAMHLSIRLKEMAEGTLTIFPEDLRRAADVVWETRKP